MKRVVIVDYESGNLFSVFHACRLLGLDPVITKDPVEFQHADGVILPGVGAFGDAMQHLENSGIADAVKEYISQQKPFLGICLGMQLLFDESEEFGSSKGLGLIKGKVRKFRYDDPSVKIPHVGWNQLSKPAAADWNSSWLKDVKDGDYMYFVHSYFVDPVDENDVFAVTDYEGKSFCAAVKKNNIFATQFHPEKSGHTGMSILKEFAATVMNNN